MTPPEHSRWRPDRIELSAGLFFACAAAIVGFVLWSWPLAKYVSTHTVVLASQPSTETTADWNLILANDQNLSVWNTAENARAITARRWGDLLSAGQCYPMPYASTLGEHMIETGILAAPWWSATGDPILSYNLALATSVVIAASGMFLFVYFHTGSMLGAFIGAIAFAFAPPRLADLSYHPAVVGVHWIPWVLWSFDRILLRGTLWRLLPYAATLLLASLVGSYPLLSLALFAGAYGLARLVSYLRSETWKKRSLALVVAGALPAAAAVVAILRTYAHVHESWALLPNPGEKFAAGVLDYLPFGMLSAGGVILAGLVPLVLLRRDEGRRAVPALAIATLLAFALATELPGRTGGVYDALARAIPLLDSVRAPGKIGLVVGLGLQALGAIGWSRLIVRLPAPAAAGVAATVLVAMVFEISQPIPRNVLGPGAVALREIAPAPERVAMLRAVLGDSRDRRAVLDLPPGRMIKAPIALLDAAYHGHPTTACYNSLGTPATRAAEELGARSRTEGGILELQAAGFGYIVERAPEATSSPLRFPAPARLVTLEDGITVWGLPHPGVYRRDTDKLELKLAGGATRRAKWPPDPPFEIDVDVTNTSDALWAQASPPSPLFADLDLVSRDGLTRFHGRARGLLPLALAPGATARIAFVVSEAPAPGDYSAKFAIDGAPRALADENFRWSDESR